MRTTTTMAAAAVCLLGLTLSAGCAIDKGAAHAEQFQSDWADTADIATVHTTHDNLLPFAGSAEGTLVVEDGTPATRVIELAEELRSYLDEHKNVSGRIQADAITFSVITDKARTGEVTALWQTLASDDRVSRASIDLEHYNGGAIIDVITADPDVTLDLFRDLVAEDDPYRPLSWTGISLYVRSEPEAQWSMNVGSDEDGRIPVEAIAAYEAVVAQLPVVSANLRNDKALIVVAKGADMKQAESLARAAAPNLGDAVEIRTERGA